MEFLIIDDDNSKIEKVSKYMGSNTLYAARSFNSALQTIYASICTNIYDGVILDMSFPRFDNEPWTIKSNMGLQILHRMKHRKIDIPVLIYSSENNNDTSEYKNVKGFVCNDNHCIEKEILDFIDICNKIKENKS